MWRAPDQPSDFSTSASSVCQTIWQKLRTFGRGKSKGKKGMELLNKVFNIQFFQFCSFFFIQKEGPFQYSEYETSFLKFSITCLLLKNYTEKQITFLLTSKYTVECGLIGCRCKRLGYFKSMQKIWLNLQAK